MEINNYRHPGKVRGPAVTGKNYFVQEANSPTEAELEEAMVELLEAAADQAEAKARREGKIP